MTSVMNNFPFPPQDGYGDKTDLTAPTRPLRAYEEAPKEPEVLIQTDRNQDQEEWRKCVIEYGAQERKKLIPGLTDDEYLRRATEAYDAFN